MVFSAVLSVALVSAKPLQMEEAIARARELLPRLGFSRNLRLQQALAPTQSWFYPTKTLSLSLKDADGSVATLAFEVGTGRVVRIDTNIDLQSAIAVPASPALHRGFFRVLHDGRPHETPAWEMPGFNSATSFVGILAEGKPFFNLNPACNATLMVDPGKKRLACYIAPIPTPPLAKPKPLIGSDQARRVGLAQPTVKWRESTWKPRAQAKLGWFYREKWPAAIPAYRVQVDWRAKPKGFPDEIHVHQDVFVVDAVTGKVLPTQDGVRP